MGVKMFHFFEGAPGEEAEEEEEDDTEVGNA